MGCANVLVVDDDNTNLVILRTLLESMGHSVILADSGPLALRLIELLTFDLVLTDVLMPSMDGAKFARHAHDLRPELPIVFITGDPNGAAKLLDDDVLTLHKPLSCADIENAIRVRLH